MVWQICETCDNIVNMHVMFTGRELRSFVFLCVIIHVQQQNILRFTNKTTEQVNAVSVSSSKAQASRDHFFSFFLFLCHWTFINCGIEIKRLMHTKCRVLEAHPTPPPPPPPTPRNEPLCTKCTETHVILCNWAYVNQINMDFGFTSLFTPTCRLCNLASTYIVCVTTFLLNWTTPLKQSRNLLNHHISQ